MSNFDELSVANKVKYTKAEFVELVKGIFEDPSKLKGLITNKTITNDLAKAILQKVNGMNTKECACCRRFDQNKLQMSPVETEFEPLLSLAQQSVKKKSF